MEKAPSSSDIHHAIDTVEVEILQLRHAMNALQRKRNALVPVGRLPSEVLTQIFLCVVFPDDSAGKAVEWTSFAFSQASHHLRNVALTCPLLWSSPITLAPALMKRC
jgi:hypothetical protein